MHKSLLFILLLTALAFSIPAVEVLGQAEVCPNIVQVGLRQIEAACSETGSNQACYGNIMIDVEAVADAPAFTFDDAGDLMELIDIQRLQLSTLQEPDLWGLALLRVQANLPGTLPGQNVTMLLLGDVTVEKPGTTTQRLDATANTGANIRTGPGTGYAIAGPLQAGDTIRVDGRNAAGDWLRFDNPGGAGATPSKVWVYAQLIDVDGDIAALEVVEQIAPAQSGAIYGPMQAFTFRSGIGRAPCLELPPDGILFQTPPGSPPARLRVNAVDVTLGSMVFMRAQPGGTMTIDVLEGRVAATSDTVTVVAPAGARIVIPLDAQGQADGPPSVTPLDNTALTALPLDLGVWPEPLPALPEPLTEEAVAEVQALEQASPEGRWFAARHKFTHTCSRNGQTVGLGSGYPLRLEAVEGGMRVTWTFDTDISTTLREVAPGLYSGTHNGNNPMTLTLDPFGSDMGTLQWIWDWTAPNDSCGDWVILNDTITRQNDN